MAKKTTKASEKETKKPASAAATKKPSKGAGGAPAIDTNLAANAAAAFVANRLGTKGAGSGTKPSESSAFKQLKENLNKPHVQGLNSVLDNSSQVKKSNLPNTHGGKQVAQHQTYNADVTRSGVPRRNAG